jgi:hypothetical protein
MFGVAAMPHWEQKKNLEKKSLSVLAICFVSVKINEICKYSVI